MDRRIIIILSLVVVLVVGAVLTIGWYVLRPQEEKAPIAEVVDEPLVEDSSESAPQDIFEQQMFDEEQTPYFVSSTPANNTLFSQAPSEVRVQFDTELTDESDIRVIRKGQDITTGETTLADDARGISVPIDAAETGNYAVKYTACLPDGGCDEGSFGFSVKLE